MQVAAVPVADHRSVNEVFGFIARLAMQSSAHLTDYVVDAGTVHMIGGPNWEQLVKISKRVGLLSQVRVDGMVAYKVIDDPDFLHLRLRDEIEWERQQRSDCRDPAIAGPVRLRDGDQCRYCGVVVQWMGRPSKRSGTLDHIYPGTPATKATMVVACRACNGGLRDIEGKEREQPKQAPLTPYYTERTAEWLTEVLGHSIEPNERPGTQPDTAPGASDPDTGPRAPRKTPTRTRQRPGSQPDTAPGASDPDTGPRAPAGEVDIKSTSKVLPATFGTSNAGSGRDGAGTAPSSTEPTARRRRSRRGRSPAPPPSAQEPPG